MKTTVSHALPETVLDTTPVAEVSHALPETVLDTTTVLVTVARVATASRGHGRLKKDAVPSLVKSKKELMPEERASESRK
jgi:hypothetical protein